MRRALLLAGVALAACGSAAVPGRAQVPGLDRLSGELTAVEVDLPGADLSAVRGPSGWVLVGASVDSGRVVGGAAPDCSLRRTASGALAAQTGKCGGFLGAYAALDRSRAFLISAGAEALPAAPIVADAAEAPAGLRYVPEADAFTLAGALWAWADASGDPVGAARAALAAVRALGERPDAGGKAALLSLVAGQLEGAERDQACAVFRARLASAGIEACP